MPQPISIKDLHLELQDSQEIIKESKCLISYVISRNISPMRLMQMYSGEVIEGDPLTDSYAKLMDLVSKKVKTADLDNRTRIKKSNDDLGLRMAIWSSEDRKSGKIDPELFTKWLIVLILSDYQPKIDDQVIQLEDTRLLDELELEYDDNLLVDVSGKRFDLRKHGLILSDDSMIYPHQFMRRFYSANFVDLLVVLNRCIQEGLKVKLRFDPIRKSTHPRYYQNVFEADYWHGKQFNQDLLMSTEKKQILTAHRTDEYFHTTYPVNFTLFRSSMMDEGMRQFAVEEFTPMTNPLLPDNKTPGMGEEFCIQKFAHFVYDQKKKCFSHVDGAVRVFKLPDYEKLFDTVTKGVDPGSRIGARHKLFLVEGAMDLKIMQSLLYEFFRYNPHIEEYFSQNPSSL